MEAKEKSKELVEKFLLTENQYKEYADMQQAKQCALIAVDEIIKNCQETTKLYEFYDIIHSNISMQPLDYWNEVKQEINNLTI